MTRLNSQSLPSAVLTSIEHIGPTSTHPERKPCLEPVLTRCFWLPRVGPRQLNILIPGQIQVYPFWIRQRIWARKFFTKIDGYKSLGSPRRRKHRIKEARILFGDNRVWMEWVKQLKTDFDQLWLNGTRRHFPSWNANYQQGAYVLVPRYWTD